MPAPQLCRSLFLSATLALGLAAASAQTTSATGDFRSLAQSATAARESGNADNAVRDYTRALALHSDWAEGWWYLGTLLYDQNRYPEAIAALQKLVTLAPNLAPAWSFLGLSEFETKDYANALAHLEKAQALGNSDDPELARVSAYHLALLLIRSGEFDQAAALLHATFGQSSLPAQTKAALGMALLRIPLLPNQIDPSQDALLAAAGEAASQPSPDALAKLIRDHPQTPWLHYQYGLALAAAGDTQQALAAQQSETALSPKSALPWLQISTLELTRGHSEDALHAAQQAVALAPDSSAAHLALSKAFEALRKNPQAVQQAQLAKSLAPEKPAPDARLASLYGIRIYDSHITGEHMTETPKTDAPTAPPSGDFDTLARAAHSAQASGNLEEAIRNYQQALALRPNWDEGQWSLAMLDYSSARYPEAIAALKSWVERKPSDGTAWAVLGLSEFALKDYDNALLHLQRGQQFGLTGGAAALAVASYHLAILLNRKAQFETATELLTPLIGQQPLAAQTRFALGMALIRIPALPDEVDAPRRPLVEASGEVAELLVASKYDQAFPKLQRLIAQYPATPFLHYAYGTALDSLSQYDEAKAEMREEIRLSPQSALPWIRLASIALQQQLPADAQSAAETAVRLAPNSAEAHYELGRAWLSLGNGEKAAGELEQAAALTPNSPEIHFALAKAYAKTNQPEKAARERAAFARLNSLAEEQRARNGDQSYRGPHDATRSSVVSTETSSPPSPQ